MTYDSWKTTGPDHSDICSECHGDRRVTREVPVGRIDVEYVDEPCSQCGDVDDYEREPHYNGELDDVAERVLT